MVSMPHWPQYIGANIDITTSLQRTKIILKLLGNPEKK